MAAHFACCAYASCTYVCSVKRAWLPNVQRKRLWSDSLNRFIDINVTTAALRDIDRAGGVDNYLLKSEITTETANRLRRLILKAQKGSETNTATNVAAISSNTSVAAAELR